MKNLLVITLFFSSFGFGFGVLDCLTEEGIDVTIDINNSLERISYNLVGLKFTKVTSQSYFAERKYQTSEGVRMVHKLEIKMNYPTFISNYYRDDNGELIEITKSSGRCKLR